MNGQITESNIEEQIQQIEGIPVFGPYLSLLAAAQLSFVDALGLLRLGAVLRTNQTPFPGAFVAIADSTTGQQVPKQSSADVLRVAA